MNALQATTSDPIYDLVTDEGIREAKFHIICKTCNYLGFRLSLYRDNIKQIANGEVPEGIFALEFITSEGYWTLFHTLAAGAADLPYRVCETLGVVAGSYAKFWDGFGGDYSRLHQICHPVPGQPKDLLKKHYLFFKALRDYVYFVSDDVQGRDISAFPESEELKTFLTVLVTTQNLLSDLLEMSTTPRQIERDEYRRHFQNLKDLTGVISQSNKSWSDTHLDVRGKCNDDVVKPTEACFKGDFMQLDYMYPYYQ